MLATMRPGAFAELEEMERLFPRDDGWAQAAMIAAMIHNALEDVRCTIAATLGGHQKQNYKNPQDLHPGAAYKTGPKKSQMQPISEVKRQLSLGNPTAI